MDNSNQDDAHRNSWHIDGILNALVLSFPTNSDKYSSITSAKYPSFCMATFSVSQNLWSSNVSHLIPATTSEEEYCHVYRYDYRNILIYSHSNSPTLPTCNIILVSLTLPAPASRDFVKLILLYKDWFLCEITAIISELMRGGWHDHTILYFYFQLVDEILFALYRPAVHYGIQKKPHMIPTSNNECIRVIGPV